jgi:hypothetical protein
VKALIAAQNGILFWGGCLLLCLSAVAVSHGQQLGSSELQISSPLSGSVVNQGQAVQVVVTPAVGVTLSQVFIVGEHPILGTGMIDVPPFQFSIVLPKGIRLGLYMLTAWAEDGSGQTVVSNPVFIDLEPSVTPSALLVDPSELYFQAQGQVLPLRVMATFPMADLSRIRLEIFMELLIREDSTILASFTR